MKISPELSHWLCLLLQFGQAFCLIFDVNINDSIAHVYLDSFLTSLSILLQGSILYLFYRWNFSSLFPQGQGVENSSTSDSLRNPRIILQNAAVVSIADYVIRVLRLIIMIVWRDSRFGRVYHILLLIDALVYSSTSAVQLWRFSQDKAFNLDCILWIKVMIQEIRYQVVLRTIKEVNRDRKLTHSPSMVLQKGIQLYSTFLPLLQIIALLVAVGHSIKQGGSELDCRTALLLIVLNWTLCTFSALCSPFIAWMEFDSQNTLLCDIARKFALIWFIVFSSYEVLTVIFVIPDLGFEADFESHIRRFMAAVTAINLGAYIVVLFIAWDSFYRPLTLELSQQDYSLWRLILNATNLLEPIVNFYPERLIMMVKSGIYASYSPIVTCMCMIDPIFGIALLFSGSNDAFTLLRCWWLVTLLISLHCFFKSFGYWYYPPSFIASNGNPWFCTMYDVEKAIIAIMHTSLGIITISILASPNKWNHEVSWCIVIFFVTSILRLLMVCFVVCNEFIYSFVIGSMFPITAMSFRLEEHVATEAHIQQILEHTGRRFQYTLIPYQLALQQRLIFQLYCTGLHDGFQIIPTSHFDGFAPVAGVSRPRLMEAAGVGTLRRQYGRVGWKKLQELNYEDRRMGLFLGYVARSSTPSAANGPSQGQSLVLVRSDTNIFARIADHDPYLLRIVLSYI